MNAPLPPDACPPTSPAELLRRFEAMRAAFAREPNPDASARRDRLARLLAMVRERERDFVAAIDRDFGHRSSHETRLAELYIVTAAARHALANVRRWMRPRRIATPIHLLPGRSWIGVATRRGRIQRRTFASAWRAAAVTM